jgi:hypothetical protein
MQVEFLVCTFNAKASYIAIQKCYQCEMSFATLLYLCSGFSNAIGEYEIELITVRRTYDVLCAFSRPIEVESCTTDRNQSFDVRFVTIAHTSKIARFVTFFQGYNLAFFSEKSRPPRPSANV